MGLPGLHKRLSRGVEMFAEQANSQVLDETVGFLVTGRRFHREVALRIQTHRTIAGVRGTDTQKPIIHNEQLGMHADAIITEPGLKRVVHA